MPPLRGVACDFCSGSPYHRWIKDIPLWQLRQKLAAAGYKIGSIISVRVLSRNASGRVEKLEIKDVSGASVALSGKDFRQLMGPNEVRSTKFDASVRWGQLLLDGRGWGHGVGMCQWGAFGQSKAGKSAEEILRHYYPGAEIVDR
jgi:stage II sporulation protein D